MTQRSSFCAALLVLLLIPFASTACAVDANSVSDDWNRTVRAAEQEGQLVLYSLSEIGDAIANTGFGKKFPRIKINLVGARGSEHVSRIMAERRAAVPGRLQHQTRDPRQFQIILGRATG